MPIDLVGLVRPHVVEMTKREDNPYVAEFRLQPLERGYGYTLGNALRRMLLSSLRGAAIWAFRLDGVLHEHQAVPGVVEDIHQIIARLKGLTLVLDEDVDEAQLHLKVSRAGPVRAGDIEPNAAVRIVHPEYVLFTLQEDRELTADFWVNKGRGYVEASQHVVDKDKKLPVDAIKIDSIYNPVRRANFTVSETRVGQRTDFDRLTLTVETNGAISPEDAVAYSAALLQEHLRHFVEFGRVATVAANTESGAAEERDSAQLRDLLAKPIDECGLEVRTINSLRNSNINTLGDLVAHSEAELLKVKNLGEKALEEIAQLLHREKLNFAMKIEDKDGVLKVLDWGVPPRVRTAAASGEEG